MLSYLSTEWNGKTYYVTADTLLRVANDVVARAAAKVPTIGNGSGPRPWKLPGDPKSWLGLAKSLRMNDENFFIIGGRYVRKHPKGYYMSDEGGVDPNPKKLASKEWGPAKGPTYPEYAQYYATTPKGRMSDADWSAAEVAKIRKILMGDAGQGAADSTDSNPRSVLAATLFLAEPARNPRAFLANIMLFDLIECQYGYGHLADPQYDPDGDGEPVKGAKAYTLQKALWHPDVIARRRTLSKPQKGSSGKGIRGTKNITSVNDLHLTGGKIPAAMTGSGYSMVRDDIRPGQIYTQAKEATLMIRWLSTLARYTGLRKGDLKPTMTEVRYERVVPDYAAIPGDKDTLVQFRSKFLQQLAGFMNVRVDSFAK